MHGSIGEAEEVQHRVFQVRRIHVPVGAGWKSVTKKGIGVAKLGSFATDASFLLYYPATKFIEYCQN